MNNRTMAVHYARALAEALPGDDGLERVQRDLHRTATLLEEHADLRTLLASPVAPSRQKKEAAERIFAAVEAHAATRRVMAMLAESGRVAILPEIIAEFDRLCDGRQGIVAAEVTTATEPPAEKLDDYRRSLERLTGAKVKMKVRIDPAILGGAVTRVGAEVYDGSLRGQLQRLGQRLKGE